MKSIKYLFVVPVILLFSLASCNRNVSRVQSQGKDPQKYDSAAFNYVYVEGIKQKLMGNNGDALKYLEQSIAINPENDAPYYQMAQIVTANGDLKNGKKFMIKALSYDQDNLWYLTMLAGIYYQEKNLDSAIVCYEKAVRFYPEKEGLLLALGNLYSENHSFDKANVIFDSFDKKYGVNEKSTLSEVKNLMSVGKFDDAELKINSLLKTSPDEILYNGLLAEIYKSKGDNIKAFDVYGKLLERNPDNPQVQLSLCDFLIGDKNYTGLFEILNTLILNPKIEKENKVTLLAKIIEIPDLGKEWQDKLVVSLMVLEANYAEDNIVPLLRPELLIKQNKLKEAADRLEDIIKVQPENYYAWEKLLIVFLQEKDYTKLLVKGEECATRFNTSFTAKLLYANGALETGKYRLALDELQKAEILAGDNKDYLVQVLTMRADTYYRMKDFSNSFQTFETALKTNSDDLTLMNNYAYYLAEQNMKLKEAEAMAKKVIEKDKGNTTFLDTYGWVLYKRGKLQEAARVMESIISSGDKSDAVWYEHYGYILKKENKCREAIDNWNIALKIDSTRVELKKEIDSCGK